MKKIFTLLMSAFLFTAVMAQPTALIKKTDVAPIVDGTIDEVWDTVDPIAIETAHGAETPTVGESWWKMLWNEEGLFLLTFVEDDVFVPAYKGTVPGESWNYDKLEIYFDANYEKKDAIGPMTSGSGHYQVAPTVKADLLEGGATTETRGEVWAFNCSDDPKYYVEVFFPFSMLLDKMGNEVDKTEPIGFDVNIMDNDILTPSRHRMNWASTGASGENWSNMDEAGLITLDGAMPGIDLTALTIAGGNAITTDNGTLQLNATIAPADATQKYKWQVTNETGMATISTDGLITAKRNGIVKVKAVSADEFVLSNEITITISGQKISLAEINMIQNSYFEKGTDGKENWGGAGIVEDSYYNLECTPKVNIWDNMFGQPKLPVADATTKYIVKFKAKASADMVVPVLMEDRNNGNNKTLTSSAPYRNSDMWNVPVTTQEQWIEFDVIFSNKQENSAYELNFQAGMVTGTFSIDSIMMYSEADFALVDPTAGAETMDASSMRVYPNPVNNTLFVELKSINSKVAIYNSVGQKLIEKTATGNRVQFDVTGLRKGMYFIKLEDGSTRKFIK